MNFLKVYLEGRSLRMFVFGFSSGLPLLLVLGTLTFWLSESKIDLAIIGFTSWVGLIYAFKWVWAPIVDRVQIPLLGPRLGRRRSWLLLAQLGLVVGLCLMAMTNPAQHLERMIAFACLTALASATQDIALDAFRIESAEVEKQGALAAMYQTGYRLGMIWAGAGAMGLAALYSTYAGPGVDPNSMPGIYFGWQLSYFTMAASVGVGVLVTLFSPEPAVPAQATTSTTPAQPWPQRFAKNVVEPFKDFFDRFGKYAILILALITTYRISDVVMGVMANPFYYHIGFSKVDIAWVSKVFGVVMTLVGSFIGGGLVVRFGVLPMVILGGVLSAITNVLFAILAMTGPNLQFLMVTVSADNLAGGVASAAFIAYLSGITNKAFTATQYALFSSLMLLLPKFVAGFSGVLVEKLGGFSQFFIFTACIGIPVVILAYLVHRFVGDRPMLISDSSEATK